jgi:hypothetical protein
MGREVDGFERLADDEEREQLAGGELDEAREVPVAAAQHRLRVLVEHMAVDVVDHGGRR